MDTNANLKEQIELAHAILRQDEDLGHVCNYEPVRLAELVLALNRWIVSTGFLPDAWRKA